MSIIGRIGCWLYHLMELADGERIRSFVLIPYRKAEAVKLLCMELIAGDEHGVYRRRIKHTYRHTVRSGKYSLVSIMGCWRKSKEVFK